LETLKVFVDLAASVVGCVIASIKSANWWFVFGFCAGGSRMMDSTSDTSWRVGT